MVESLTSYLSRLADAHSVTVGTLIGKILVPLHNKKYLINSSNKGGSRFYDHAFELNGFGMQAYDFAKVLSELTGINSIKNLTLLPWQNIISVNGLFNHSKAWCPVCLEEYRVNNQQVYEPLIWNFKSAKICSVHNVILESKCHHCKKEIPILTRKSRNGFCPFCGCWLGAGYDYDKSKNMVSEEELQFEYFIIKNIGDIIENGNRLMLDDAEGKIHNFIKSIVQSEGGVVAFSKHFGIPKSTVSPWVNGKNKPLFDTLLKICFSANMNVIDIFSSNEKIINSISINKKISFKCDEKIVKRRIINWSFVEDKLNEVIHNKPLVPPSVREVARNLNCDSRLLYNHFPKQCKVISDNHDTYIKMAKNKRIDDGCKKVFDATVTLYKSGIYPSRRNVEAILSPNLLLREKPFQITWEKTLKGLGIVNNNC